MDLNLRDRCALVCASSKGIGYAIAHALAQEGARVILSARNESDLVNAQKNIVEETGADVSYICADLSTSEGSKKLFSAATSEGRNIDILINNVGGPNPTKAQATQADEWESGFHKLFASAAELNRLVIPTMREKKFGRIVHITSLSVIEPIENLAVSNAMRAAVTSYAKTLATELAEDGITVNCIMPGIIHTDRINFLRSKQAERLGTSLEEELEKTRANIPAKRLGKPEELAALAAFLCSPKASYITGANIAVDGGLRKSWA
jgi:3-oxoacyl-[acyl-carrier protein] reductase